MMSFWVELPPTRIPAGSVIDSILLTRSEHLNTEELVAIFHPHNH